MKNKYHQLLTELKKRNKVQLFKELLLYLIRLVLFPFSLFVLFLVTDFDDPIDRRVFKKCVKEQISLL